MDLTQYQQYLPVVIGVVLVAYAIYKDNKKATPAAPVVLPVPKVVVPAPVAPKGEGPAEAVKASAPEVSAKDVEADKAKNTLLAAGVKGTELLQTLVAVRRGEITAKDVEDAHKDKNPEKAPEAK